MSGNSSAEEAAEVQSLVDGSLLADAEDANIDVDAIIDSTVDEYREYSAQTQKRFVESAITQQLDTQGTETFTGVLCGSRDRYGKNWPRRHALIRSNGEHIEASTWESALPTSDGGEITTPAGAAVEIQLEYDDEYDSYEAVQLNGVTELPHDDLARKLGTVAVSPGDLQADDEFSMVAVRGEVGFVNPQTVFDGGSPQGDGPVMLADERGKPKPHMEIVLSEDENTRVRAHAERQRNATPYFEMEDFEKLVRDAADNFDTPQDQASFIDNALTGREVVVVGNVNSYDTNRGSDGSVTNYVDIGLAGMVGMPPGLGDGTPTEDAPEPETQPDASDADTPPGDTDFAEVRNDIGRYADLVGLTLSDLTAEVIEENTSIEAPPAVIETAIDQLKGDGVKTQADPGTEATNGAATTVDDPVEACHSDDIGQYECPQEGCLFSASGKPSFLGHLVATHVGGDDDPDEWLANKVSTDA